MVDRADLGSEQDINGVSIDSLATSGLMNLEADEGTLNSAW